MAKDHLERRKRHIHLVLYDMGSDRLRQKLADTLERVGMHRIQYSAFLGEVKPAVLQANVHPFFDKMDKTDRLFILPIPRASLEGMITQGWTGELKHILGEDETRVIILLDNYGIGASILGFGVADIVYQKA